MMNDMRMMSRIVSARDRMQEYHVRRGVEGIAEFVYPYIANMILLRPEGNGTRLFRLICKALKPRIERLCVEYDYESLDVDDFWRSMREMLRRRLYRYLAEEK